MAYTPWNAGTPIGTEPANTLDEIIVELKAQITERNNDILDPAGQWDTDDPILLSKTAYDPFVDLEHMEHWSIGNPTSALLSDWTGNTNHYTTAAGQEGTNTLGIRPGTNFSVLRWEMPIILAPGYILTAYKARVFVPSAGTNASIELELFRSVFGADGSTPGLFSMGTTGTLTDTPGEFRTISVSGLTHTILDTESYFARIHMINDNPGTCWLYGGGPVYDTPDLATRL